MNKGDNSNARRRRGTKLERALYEATLAELKAVGYRRLSFDGVALRAGTSKAVIYRRWNNRQELVIAALSALHLSAPGPAPDTGSLRGDVLAVFLQIGDSWNSLPIDIGLGLLTDTENDMKLHEYFLRRIKQASADMMMPSLTRAEARGEIATAALPERVITLPFDLVRHEIVVTGRPPSNAAIAQIIDDIYLPLLQA